MTIQMQTIRCILFAQKTFRNSLNFSFVFPKIKKNIYKLELTGDFIEFNSE